MSEDTQTPIQAPLTGDEIILSTNGRPWPTAKDAERALKSSNRDLNTFGTLAYEGGYAIATWRKINEIRERQLSDQGRDLEARRTPPPMKFYEVKIHPRGNDNESNTVLLSFNNDAFVANRGEVIILDEPHMEVLRNAANEDLQPVDKITQSRNPERALKAGRSLVYRFPFTVLRESTKGEFESFMSKMRGETEKNLQAEQLKAIGATA